jgi:hypothetical protein
VMLRSACGNACSNQLPQMKSLHSMFTFLLLLGNKPVLYLVSLCCLFFQTTSSWLGLAPTAWRIWSSPTATSFRATCGTRRVRACWTSSSPPSPTHSSPGTQRGRTQSRLHPDRSIQTQSARYVVIKNNSFLQKCIYRGIPIQSVTYVGINIAHFCRICMQLYEAIFVLDVYINRCVQSQQYKNMRAAVHGRFTAGNSNLCINF